MRLERGNLGRAAIDRDRLDAIRTPAFLHGDALHQPFGQRAGARDRERFALEIGDRVDRRVRQDDHRDIARIGGIGGNRDGRRALGVEHHTRSAADADIDGVRSETLHQLRFAGERNDLGLDAVFCENALIGGDFADGEGPADLYRLADAQLIGGLRAARGQQQADAQERGAALSHGYLAGTSSLMRM